MTDRRTSAERFRRFRVEYLSNGGNAYRAALAAGYSERMARSKSYRLAQLLRAHAQLQRLGLASGASADSYPATPPLTAAQNSGKETPVTSATRNALRPLS